MQRRDCFIFIFLHLSIMNLILYAIKSLDVTKMVSTELIATSGVDSN